jgi:DNA-binding winged helix-turn-helix (wHTH) protein/TolB-like protein
MDVSSPSDVFVFGQFRLNRRGGGVLRCAEGGDPTPVKLGSRALDVLGVLVDGHGDLVSKDEIMTAVWPGTAVEEANLSVQISALRRVLDRDRVDGSCIQTVAGRGYRFAVPVTQLAAPTGEPEASASEDAPSPPRVVAEAAAPKRRFTAASIGAVAVVLLAILAAGFGWILHDQAPPRPLAYSPQDRRYSVIVLPFENSSGDPAQNDRVADVARAVTEQIARDNPILLAPATTAAAYQGKPYDLKAIGRDHDVHFALTGSARHQDGHLIVAATLYETDDERAVWSRRFDRPDSQDALDHVAHLIDDGYWQASIDAEAARAMREHPDSLDKRDLMAVAKSTALFQTSKANDLAALALMERALALDPNYVLALREAARMHARLVIEGFSSDPDADLAAGSKLIDRALQLKPNDPWVLREQANVLRAQGRLDDAVALLHRVIEMLPEQAFRRRELGQILLMQRHYQEALDNLLTARRLASEDDDIQQIDASIAMALLVNDRYPEAVAQARLAISECPVEAGREAEIPWLTLIAGEIADGQDAAARADLRTFLAAPRTLHSVDAVQKSRYLAAIPKLLDGLRLTGMPEQ